MSGQIEVNGMESNCSIDRLYDMLSDLRNRVAKLESVQRPELYNPIDPEDQNRIKAVERSLNNMGFRSHKDIRLKLEAASRKRKDEVNA